jgi:hypothetical protein
LSLHGTRARASDLRRAFRIIDDHIPDHLEHARLKLVA